MVLNFILPVGYCLFLGINAASAKDFKLLAAPVVRIHRHCDRDGFASGNWAMEDTHFVHFPVV